MLSDLFLIRHGQPVHDPSIPYHTHPGPALSEHGRGEAARAAEFLAGREVEHLFVSPFARTSQTAEVLAERLGLPVTFTTLVQEQAPGEPFEQVRRRVCELLGAAEDSPYTRIAIVSHGSPIRAALLELSNEKIDLSRHVYGRGNPAPTCGIWHVQFLDAYTRRFELVFKPD